MAITMPGRAGYTRVDDRKSSFGTYKKTGAPTVTRKSGSRSSSGSSGGSGGVAGGESFSSILNRTMSDVTKFLPGLDAAARASFNAALTAAMPDWQQKIFGTASATIGNLSAMAENFKTKVMPQAMAQVNEISTKAMGAVSEMLSGKLPRDVSDEVDRLSAEIGFKGGVRENGNLVARNFGLTSLAMMEKGMTYAPNATTLASNAYLGFANVLNTPMPAVNATANMLSGLHANTTDPASLLTGLVGQATGQSQFGTNTGNQNYWNGVNAGAQREAVGVARDQLSSTQDYQNQLLKLQREQMLALQDSQLKNIYLGDSSGASVDFSTLTTA